MNEHQRHTEFLRQCILYDDTAERDRLETRLTQLQRDERCIRRAIWLVCVLAALSMAGLSYWVVFVPDFPPNISRFMTLFLTKGLCVLGLASLICLFCFVALGASYRRRLDEAREDCRQLATRVMAARLGQPGLPAPRSDL